MNPALAELQTPLRVAQTLEVLRRILSEPLVVTGSVALAGRFGTVLANATGGALTVTLPPAREGASRRVTVMKTDASANAVTLDGVGAETINGAATLALTSQYDVVTLESDGSAWWRVSDALASAGSPGAVTTGTAVLDFGAFPGASDASVAVTGQAGILAGSAVTCWLAPVATADHSADEHLVESIRVVAGSIVPGVGFTIYGISTNQLLEPLETPGASRFRSAAATVFGGVGASVGGRAPRVYGTWTVGWLWT